MTGLPLADDLRSLFRRLIHPDDQAGQADLWDLIQLGHAVDREFRIIRPDHTVRWVALKTDVVLGPDARPARTDGVLLDTTAPHEAREITAWMQGRQTGVLRAVTAATWSAHPAGEIEMAAGWEQLTGQSAAEMAGLGWLDALHPDDRRSALAAWQAARTTARPTVRSIASAARTGRIAGSAAGARRRPSPTDPCANGSASCSRSRRTRATRCRMPRSGR